MNTRGSAGKAGWNAMPRSPASLCATLNVRPVMSSTVVAPAGFVPVKRRTSPSCCSTYQCSLLFGACSIFTGMLKVRLVKRESEIVLPAFGVSHALHVVLEGRLSSPLPAGAAGVVALPAPEESDTLPAASTARTVYEYAVEGVRPMSEYVVVVTVTSGVVAALRKIR